MAIINQASKELQVKIVYYGPALGGKTTNLVQVHDHVQTANGQKGKLVSLATRTAVAAATSPDAPLATLADLS